jgi:hypothetical protein
MLPRDADIVQSSPENCRRVGVSHRPKAQDYSAPDRPVSEPKSASFWRNIFELLLRRLMPRKVSASTGCGREALSKGP